MKLSLGKNHPTKETVIQERKISLSDNVRMKSENMETMGTEGR